MKIAIPYLPPERKCVVVGQEHKLNPDSIYNFIEIEQEEWDAIKHLPIEEILKRQADGNNS
jgi:hypothetical protein